MNRTLHWALSGLAALAISGGLRADDPPPGKGDKGAPGGEKGTGKGEKRKGEGKGQARLDPERIFGRLDRNSDGFISADELPEQLPPAIATMIKNADADKDGKISKEELGAAVKKIGEGGGKVKAKRPGKGPGKGEPPAEGKGAPPAGDAKKPGEPEKGPPPKGKGEKGIKGDKGAARGEAIFARLDTDKDGKISKDEAKGPLADRFAEIDADKDGFLTKQEIARGMAGALGKGGPGGPGAGRGQGKSALDIFNSQDADGDGRVSKAEAKGALADQFDKLDADKDGKLTRQEAEAGLKGAGGDKGPPPGRKRKQAP
jgi:Ca2+-binding EF-hand superfamily protein